MNTKPSPGGKVLAAISASALLLAPSLNSSAADGTWAQAAAGNWSDPLNWSGGTLADGPGSKADFSTVDLNYFFPTVTLDLPRTNGSLVFGDTDNLTPGGWVLAGSTLTLSNSLALPVITVNAMNSSSLGYDPTNDVIVSAVLAGGQGFIKKGAGTLTLTASNTMGQVQIDAGLIAAFNSQALGAGNQEVRYNGGGLQLFNSSGLRLGNTNRVLTTGYIICTNVGGSFDNFNGPWSGSGTMYLDLKERFTVGGGAVGAFAGFTGTIDLTDSKYFSLFRINLGNGDLYDMSAIALNTGTREGRFAPRLQKPGTWRIGALTGGPVTTLDSSENSGGTLTTWEIGALNLSTIFQGRLRHYQDNAGSVGALNKVGSGKLTLTHANNSYKGNTTISQGVLALSGSGALPFTPRISILSGAVFDVSGRTTAWGPTTNIQVLEGSGGVVGDVNAVQGTISPGTSIGTLSFSNNLALTEGVTTLFEITGPGVNDSILVAGDLTLNSLGGGVVVRVVPTGAVIPNGTYPLFKWGGSLPAGDTNALVLTYPPQSGTLTLEQNLATREIYLKVTGVVGAANLTWRGDGGANNWNYSTPNWRGDGTTFKDGDNVSFDDSGSNNVPVNLVAAVNPGLVVVKAAKDYVFSSTAGGRTSGSGNLLKTNSGWLTLLTDNDYRDTTIAGGTVVIGDGVAFQGSLGTGNITNNGTLIYNRPDPVTNAIAIQGTGAVVHRGGELLVLEGNNSYSGGTTISNNSTVLIGSITALGLGPVNLAGGTLSATVVTLDNAVNVSADSTIDNPSSANLAFNSGVITCSGGTLTLSGTGPIRLYGAGITYDGPIDLQTTLQSYNSDGLQIFNGIISGPGQYRRHWPGPNLTGGTILNAPNTYYGGTVLREGSIGFGTSTVSAFPPTIDSGPIGTGPLNQDTASYTAVFASGGPRSVANPIVLNPAGQAFIIKGSYDLTLSGPVDLGGADKAIQVDNIAKSTLSGDISNGNFIKSGAGTLYINGNNYANSTLVSEGTLGGTGTFSSPVTVAAGATLAPGMSVGTLTINSDLTVAGDLAIEVNKNLSPSSDNVSVSGVLTQTGTGTVKVTNLGPALAVNDKFTLFSKLLVNGGAMTVSGAGYTWANNLAADGSITVTGLAPPPTLNVTQVGNSLQFSWSGDFKLQSQTNALNVGISTNWFDYPGGSSSPVSAPINAASGSVFFRLISTW